MMKIKFLGPQIGDAVTISAIQGGVAAGPLTISAWQASTAGTPGTFRVRVSIEDHNWTEVAGGEVIETVAPGRVKVFVDTFADWADNDPRNIFVETDMGERWDFSHTNNPNLPASLRHLAGDTAGLYQGLLCGHAMRGTDMAGSQVLTATYDQGNGAPVGTLDQTVTIYVSDGLASKELTFTVRLIHPDVYYYDRAGIYAPNAPETDRRGTYYVSADGDFTGAPPERAETATVSGIYHITANAAGIPGGFGNYNFELKDGPGGNGWPQCCRILFKAGQTFTLISVFDLERTGINASIGTWYHGGVGGTDKAVWDMSYMARYDEGAQRTIYTNYFNYLGSRFYDIILKASDYDVSDVTWREWWNIINISNLVGTIDQNTQANMASGTYNGEILTDALGNATRVIAQNGNELLCLEVVTDAAHFNDRTQIATESAFADGATLTGQTNGATMTFVAAGSRQDRINKTPPVGFGAVEQRGTLIDNCEIHGASVAVSGMAPGFVLSDTLIQNYWNYGADVTGAVPNVDWAEVGVVTVQPANYEGTPRSFGGATVSENRNTFNTVTDDPTVPATNDVSHSGRRFKVIDKYCAHQCFMYTYGGHGNGHQPQHRLNTGGSLEYACTIQFSGCGFAGGEAQLHWGQTEGSPMTPYAIRAERTHMQGTFASSGTNYRSTYTNFAVRNCMFDQPLSEFPVVLPKAPNIAFLGGNQTSTFNPDPDENAVPSIVEYNTFSAEKVTAPAANITLPAQDIRGVPITYTNNAYRIDDTVFASVEPTIAAQADAPADFTTQWQPLATAKAYQSATGTPPAKDASSVTRPSSDVSKGAFEPE